MGVIGYMVNVVFGAMASGHDKVSHGLMFPRESETREVRSLDGMWNFVRSNVTNPSEGIRDRWYDRDLAQNPKLKTIPMPVPSSYNDITEDASLRDHVGTVWYDRKFFAPKSWGEDQRVWVRFGSVHYESFVVSQSFFWESGKRVLLIVLRFG
jgi:beta-glucuronidase